MEKTWRLYRAYGRDGRLLYLGQTTRPDLRIRQHEADKAWAREVSRWRVERRRYRSELAVLRAEAAAIRAERPLFNIEHNEENPGRVNPHTMRYASGVSRGFLYRPDLYADVHDGCWVPGAGRRRGLIRCLRGLRVGRFSFWGWAGAWVLLAGFLAPVFPGGSEFIGSALILAFGYLVVRKVFNK